MMWRNKHIARLLSLWAIAIVLMTPFAIDNYVDCRILATIAAMFSIVSTSIITFTNPKWEGWIRNVPDT